MAEEESKGSKYADILKVVGGILLGGMLGGTRAAGTLRRAMASDVLKGSALTYPGLTENFVYPIEYSPDFATYGMNSHIDRNLIHRYPLAQTLDECGFSCAHLAIEGKYLSIAHQADESLCRCLVFVQPFYLYCMFFHIFLSSFGAQCYEWNEHLLHRYSTVLKGLFIV